MALTTGITDGGLNHHEDVDDVLPLLDENTGGTIKNGKPSIRTLKNNLMSLCTVPLAEKTKADDDVLIAEENTEILTNAPPEKRKRKCCTMRLCLGLLLAFIVIISLLAFAGATISIIGLRTGAMFFRDTCILTGCYNDGLCEYRPSSGYVCSCPEGTYGYRCEEGTKRGVCATKRTYNYRYGYENKLPCENGGTCVPDKSGYNHFCICPEGYYGKTCSESYRHQLCGYESNEQKSSWNIAKPRYRTKCNNKGTCIPLPPYDYLCACDEGYYGPHCEYDAPTTKTPPRPDLCSYELCKNGGTCVSIGSNDFRCYCKVGYSGTLCEKVMK